MPQGRTLVIGCYQGIVNGQDLGGPGAYVAYPSCPAIDMTLTDGAYDLVEAARAQSVFCQRLAEAVRNGWDYQVVQGLPEWRPTPC